MSDGLTFIHLMEYIWAAAEDEAMATIPTPEETALKILDIFVHDFKCRPWDVLQRRNLDTLWHKRGLAAEDFGPGMEFAVQQGWIEVLSARSWLRLTTAGFAKV